MPLTGAERTRRYREKLKLERPQEYERQRKKNLEKVKSKKKKVSELSPEEAKSKRENWRRYQRIRRMKQKRQQDIAKSRDKSAPSGSSTKSNEVDDLKKLRRKLQVLANKNKRYSTNNDKLKKNLQTSRKQYYRLKQKADKEIENMKLEINKMKARQEMLENTLKTTYKNSSMKEKKVLKKLAFNSRNKVAVSKMMGLKGKVRQRKKKTSRKEIPEITDFYTRDDISRNTAGKKEVRTKNKEKIQIRYLLNTLRDSYKIYRDEGGRYGFTTFYLHKPFYVLSPRMSSRSTCLCVKHSNFEFLHGAMIKNGLIKGRTKDTLSQVSCDLNNYDCMWNKCLKCKDKKVKYQELDDEISEKQIEWSCWGRKDHTYQKKEGNETKEITTKKTGVLVKRGTITELKDNFENYLILFKKHYFNMTHQQAQYQKAVKELKENEAVIVCDFSENYQAKLAQEIQAMHYGASNLQICLHTGMVFWKDRSQSFCTLSDNTCHQPAAIWAHLTPIINMIKEYTPNTTVIHFYSDGPSSQYRQKQNFYLLVHFTKKYSLQYTTWSFYEAGHGKNVADGIGGSIKRSLDRKVCMGNDITDAQDAFKLLKKCCKVTKVFLIESSAIEDVSKILPDKLLPLKGTMQLHQIVTKYNDSSAIKYRDVGCFCGELRGQCQCFSPKSHILSHSSQICSSTSGNSNLNNQDNEEEIALSLENGIKQLKKDIYMEQNLYTADTNEFSRSLELAPNLLDGLNIEESVDLNAIQESVDLNTFLQSVEPHAIEESVNPNTIDLNPLNVTSEEKDAQRKINIGNHKSLWDSWHLLTNVNEQTNNLQCTEKSFMDNPGIDITLKPPQVFGKNIPISKGMSKLQSIKKINCYVNPKKIIIRPVKSPIQDNTVPFKNTIEESCVVKKEIKDLPTKPKITSSVNINRCKKCYVPLLTLKGKCILCKTWFCWECMQGSSSSDYICEACFAL